MMVTHFEVEVLDGTLSQPLCQNNAGRDAIEDAGRKVAMSTLDHEVTCKRCLRALGYQLPTNDAREKLLDLTVQQLTGGTYRVAA